MKRRIHYLSLILIALVLFMEGCSKDSNPVEPEDNSITSPLDPFDQNKLLGRGMNIGNALEATKEGEWGVTIRENFFTKLKEKGFQSVRVPIKWSAHASQSSPYKMDDVFFQRIDWVISKALSNNLAVIINIHHYDEIFQNPADHKQRFLALWKQISERYVNQPKELFFEILNEPNSNLKFDIWNEYLAEAISVIRDKNPYRTLIIGPADWNSVNSLNSLIIPENEKNVIVTFHYYSPFNFTHQGAGWVNGSDAWLGTKWLGTESEKNAVNKDFDNAVSWSVAKNRPIYIGEFGAFNRADINSRVRWTSYIARQAEQRNFSWSYWEFCSGFGIYDQYQDIWNTPLLNALIPGGA